jgi:SAM-dependent methyltransferase
MKKRETLNCEEQNIAWYEACADEYATDALTHDMSWPYRDFLSNLGAPLEGKRVLDLGCGSGRDLAYFILRGLDAEGIDACELFCAKARELSGAQVTQMKFSELDLAPAYYDGIFANGVLMHVEESYRKAFAQELVSSLKLGGILYFHSPRGEAKQVCEDGRLLYLSEQWPEIFESLGLKCLLNEGRPAFLPSADQTWQAGIFVRN